MSASPWLLFVSIPEPKLEAILVDATVLSLRIGNRLCF